MVAVGKVVAGRYRVGARLAAGGMGRVWLAVDETTADRVALKKCVLPDGLTDDERVLFRVWTVREARAFARVSHPHVIRTRDVLPDTDAPWIVMDYVPSRSLQQVIDTSGALPPARVAAIGLAVLEGLLAIHRAGLLHLDVKPDNVLMADDGRVVLTDFGPAVTAEGVRALAGAGIILASPKYLAPERLIDGVALPESDLWSLGATLYHAVEGRPPYPGTSEDALHALAANVPDEPRRAGPLAPVLAGLLRRDPADRLSPAEVAARLRAVARPAHGPPAAVARPAPTRGPSALRRLAAAAGPGPTRGPSALRRLAVAAVALGVLGALGSVVVLVRPGDQTPAGIPRFSVPAPSASTFALPDGFVWWAEPLHYRVAVPGGWDRRATGADGLVTAAPAGRPVLRISVWPVSPSDVVATLIAEERDTRLAGYRRIRIERLPESPDAVWEYTYTDPDDGPMRGRQQVITTGGRTYAIDWRTSRQSWTRHMPQLLVVLDSFTPVTGR